MQMFFTKDKDFKLKFDTLLNRGKMDIQGVSSIVSGIIDEVRQRQDEAILEQISKFDRWNPKTAEELLIDEKDTKKAYDELSEEIKDALKLAFKRIKKYHKKQLPKSWLSYEKNGTILGQKVSPVDSAGLYIPGGKAAYPSSLLMNAIPAIVAGVKKIVVCTPAVENEINPLVLAALHLLKIKNIYKVGGASAIAAMAYGTKTIPKVDVITGPGNIFVATAKKMVFGEVNIDMIAGPSEIGILADGSSNIDWTAMDLLSQAEHDEMASSILITPNEKFAKEVKESVYNQLKTLSREKIARASIENRAAIIVTKDLKKAIDLMNKIAPEHLELLLENSFEVLPKIKHAGAIFMGNYTPEPIGDYIAGPNHTLPTGGTAKFYSPLNVEHFMKKSSIISLSKEGMQKIGKECAILAKNEGLGAHEKSVLMRLDYLN